MTETGIVNVQISSDLKQDAEKVLAKLGLTPDEAIEEFYRDVLSRYQEKGDAWLEVPRVSFCMCWGKPPNAETLAAFEETDHAGRMRFDSLEEMIAYFDKTIDEDDEEDA